MAEPWELTTRHEQQVERIQLQADLRRQDKISASQFDVEVERIRGDNERELERIRHEVSVENRALDVKFQEFGNAQQLRLEAAQTAIKQQDDFFRHFWDIDKAVLQLETQLIEMVVAARITAQQTVLEHGHSLEHKEREQRHELAKITHETDQAIRKERALKEINREFEQMSAEDVAAVIKKLDNL